MNLVKSENRIRIAIQKSGRLSTKSFSIFERSGIDFDTKSAKLFARSSSFPIDILLVRDDDIPNYIASGVCDVGIVGRNVLTEHPAKSTFKEIRALGFGRCRLSIAAPEALKIYSDRDLDGLRIATSYPSALSSYLKKAGVTAQIVVISGSVEVSPALGMADAVCDLVSSGATLKANGLREIKSILESEAVLAGTSREMCKEKQSILDSLLMRFDGVLKAEATKYIMMNAPSERVSDICKIFPGMENPTVLPLAVPGRVAIHAVAREGVFWETITRLKELGASSILVSPIEKVIA